MVLTMPLVIPAGKLQLTCGGLSGSRPTFYVAGNIASQQDQIEEMRQQWTAYLSRQS